MALAYLLDPCQQYQNRAGVNNVAGYLEVFRMDTDDRATVYVNFNGTLAPEHIGIDNDGRAVMIVESGRPYRVEMHGPNGDLFWTQQPVWPLAGGGGGVSGTDVVSTDGSISVDRTTVGSVTTYDLSANVEDSTDLLNWIRCEGATHIDGGDIWKPTYAAGTMVVGTRGIQVSADQFYHVTAHVRATKTSASPYYDNVYLLYSLDDGTSVTPVTRQSVIVDCSLGLSQDFEFSTDVMVTTDGELLFSIVGQDQAGISFDVLNMELHRVFSGAPYIPGGVADKPWVENNYQEKLTAGANITIDENNVISASGSFAQVQADWTENDPSDPSYIKHRPDLSLYVTDSELDTILEGYATTEAMNTALRSYPTKMEVVTALRGKQDTISDLVAIRSGAQLGATSVQPGSLATVAFTGDYADLLNQPTIPDNVACFAWDSNRQFPPISYNAALAAYNAKKVLVLFDYGRSTPSSAMPVAVTSQYEFGTTTVGGIHPEQVDYVQFMYDGLYSGSDQASYLVKYRAYSNGNTAKSTHTLDIGKVDDVKVNGTSVLDSDNVAQITLPDFSQYATTSAMNTALAGKQDIIPDLDSIRAKADLGATAVQPSTLNSTLQYYVMDSELSTILQGYQEALTAGSNIQISNGTISATDTTYTAGTGISINNGVITNTAPNIKSDWNAASGSDAEILNKPTIPTVDQTYGASSTNAQSGVAVAQAISAALGSVETALANL